MTIFIIQIHKREKMANMNKKYNIINLSYIKFSLYYLLRITDCA